MLAMSLSLYILVALYSWVFSSRRLSRPGVSSEVRQLFSRKHSFYVGIFIVIWTSQLLASYYHLFNPVTIVLDNYDASLWKPKPVDLFSGIMMFTTGIFLAALRLYEPFFLYLIKKFGLNCMGILYVVEGNGV